MLQQTIRNVGVAVRAVGAAWALASAAQAGVTQWVPLEVREGHVLFPVEIEGHSGYAMFDTGSQGNSVSVSFVEKAGLNLSGRKYQITGVGSTDDIVSSVSSLPIKLFGVDFKLPEVPALPQATELTIGAGFLKAAVLQLDYPSRRMRLITHDSVDLSKVANVPMQLERGSGLPAIQLTVDGKERWMLLDTGNTGPILVRRMLAEEGDWIARFKRAESEAVDVNADITALDILVLPAVKIGPFELEDVPVAVPAQGEDIRISGTRATGPEGDSRIRKGVRVSGIVGYELLRHFVVTIDYDREKVHIGLPAEEKPAAAPSGSAEAKP